jgi:hypothetical protein
MNNPITFSSQKKYRLQINGGGKYIMETLIIREREKLC